MLGAPQQRGDPAHSALICCALPRSKVARVGYAVADDFPSKLETKRSQLMSVSMPEHDNIPWLVGDHVIRAVGRN